MAARDHYAAFGLSEGRQASPDFNARFYLNNNPDLRAAGFGPTAAWDHYRTSGVHEGRASAPTFDARFYMSRNPDLAGAFGAQGYAAATGHFLSHGRSEGRPHAPLFDSRAYLDRHPDLRNALGGDYAAALQHYVAWGRSEGRDASRTSNFGIACDAAGCDLVDRTKVSGAGVMSDNDILAIVAAAIYLGLLPQQLIIENVAQAVQAIYSLGRNGVKKAWDFLRDPNQCGPQVLRVALVCGYDTLDVLNNLHHHNWADVALTVVDTDCYEAIQDLRECVDSRGLPPPAASLPCPDYEVVWSAARGPVDIKANEGCIIGAVRATPGQTWKAHYRAKDEDAYPCSNLTDEGQVGTKRFRDPFDGPYAYGDNAGQCRLWVVQQPG